MVGHCKNNIRQYITVKVLKCIHNTHIMEVGECNKILFL